MVRWAKMMGAGLGALALACSTTPAVAAPKKDRKAVSLSAPGSLGSFTPAAADPKTAAFLRESAGERGFRFTPAGASAKGSKGVTVEVRSRGVNSYVAARGEGITLTPSAFNLGVSIGWKALSLTGEVARADNNLASFKTESVDLGLSYSGKNWRATAQVGEEDSNYRLPLGLSDKRYSFGIGGAYSVSPNLAVTGGVRYQVQPDSGDGLEKDRDARSVYLGTSLAF